LNNMDPMSTLISEIKEAVSEALKPKYENFIERIEIQLTKDRKLGDLFTQIAFQIAFSLYDKSEARKKVNEIAEEIAEKIQIEKISLVKEIKVINGYINFHIDYGQLGQNILSTILSRRDDYGKLNIGKNKKVIVEHTSANPIHPLHIGTARNSVLGDSIARILRNLNYNVKTHFYVNDMGRQVAYLVYAYSKIRNEAKVEGKPDHFFGALYSVSASIIETKLAIEKIREVKGKLVNVFEKMLGDPAILENEDLRKEIMKNTQKIRRLRTTNWLNAVVPLVDKLIEKKSEKAIKLIEEHVGLGIRDLKDMLKKAKEWLDVLAEVALKWPDIFNKLVGHIFKEKDIEGVISGLIKKYEKQEETTTTLFREVCNLVLQGFKETLDRVGIKFDKFDWESELVWSGDVRKILDRLEEKGWGRKDKTGAIYLDIQRSLLEKEYIRAIFDVPKAQVEKAIREKKEEESLPPNLVLVRSDGTTLYTTRDIAYALRKVQSESSDIVYNIIGKDQTLPQKQLKAALHLAGYEEVAKKIHHVAYELVIIPGAKLSARRGRYITFDEILDEAEERAYHEVNIRQQELPEELKKEIAREVAIGAVRYALLSNAPDKVITFEWDRVLDFERNSGPFLQYAYARAVSILRKANWEIPDPDEVSFEVLEKDIEKELILQLALFPSKVLEAGTKLRPDIIAEYANKLAVTFNSFYQRFPVLKAETEELRKARLILVDAFRTVMKNALTLLGIKSIEKM